MRIRNFIIVGIVGIILGVVACNRSLLSSQTEPAATGEGEGETEVVAGDAGVVSGEVVTPTATPTGVLPTGVLPTGVTVDPETKVVTVPVPGAPGGVVQYQGTEAVVKQ